MKIIRLAPLVAILIIIPIVFMAADARGATVSYDRISIAASFSKTDGCTQTQVDVAAMRGSYQSATGTVVRTGEVHVSIQRWDTCTGATLEEAEGTLTTPDLNITLTSNMSTATAAVVVPVVAEETQVVSNVSVNLTWSKKGSAIKKGTQPVRLKGGGVIKATYQTVPASLTGTITEGTDNLIAGATPTYASIERVTY
jgi:hypothetical protein